MTPEEIVESLVEKFDGANDIIANYLVHKSLEFDDCIVMGSCDIVFDQLTLIERSIRALAGIKEHQTLLRNLATEVERLLAKIKPNIETLSRMEIAMIFDVALISETIGILRHSLNINDKETHKELTALAMGSVGLHKTANSGADIDAIRLSLDGDFDKFFTRIETDIKRLEYIYNFRDLRKCAHNFDMYNFQEALEDLHSYMKKYGIKAFEWSPDDDDIVEKENITCANLRDIFYTGEDVATDEEAAQKAGERKHVYFSLGHIQYIHENFVCEQFHSIDPHDLYAILNLLDCDKRLKIREGEKNRVYYFINVVGNLVQTDLQLNWRKTICQHLGLSYKAYNSKYKEAEDSENPRTVEFREKIEELIENFDELAKAS